VLREGVDDVRDGRGLLADRDVDADDAGALLVDDRVDAERGLPGLAVAQDQLALAAADGDHGVDRLPSGLQRLLDGLALDDVHAAAFDVAELLRGDRALAVERLPERVHHAAEHLGADRHLGDLAGALGDVAFLDAPVRSQDDAADRIFLEVEGLAEDAAGELDEFAGLDLVEAVDARDAVAHREHHPDRLHLEVGLVALDLLLDDGADLFGADSGHLRSPRLSLLQLSEPLADRLEAVVDRPVDDVVAEHHEHSALDARIDLGVDRDLLAGEPLQLRLQAGAVRLAERFPAFHGDLDDALRGVGQPVEHVRDFGEDVLAVLVDEEL